MAENMVRAQVYLPRDLLNELKKRAKEGKWSLAEEIRSGLRYYLAWTKEAKEEQLPPLDLGNLFEIIGKYGGSGLGDAAENHDKYIYGDPHGEKALERERLRAELKRPSVAVVQERRAVYRAKKRPTAKRKGSCR